MICYLFKRQAYRVFIVIAASRPVNKNVNTGLL